MPIRTKERGLLTTADAFHLTFTIIDLQKAAHGDDLLASKGCLACARMERALGRWLGAHAASEKELDELKAAKQAVRRRDAHNPS
jgi:hypothetical protein